MPVDYLKLRNLDNTVEDMKGDGQRPASAKSARDELSVSDLGAVKVLDDPLLKGFYSDAGVPQKALPRQKLWEISWESPNSWPVLSLKTSC